MPGIVFDDGAKVHGSRPIIRALEERHPEPSLANRPGGDQAEAWGDQELQPLVRRVIWQALSKDRRAQESYIEGAKLVPPTPPAVARASAGAVAFLERRLNKSTPDAVRADLAQLPADLDRVDAWIADGTLGGETETAADLQVFASLRLLHDARGPRAAVRRPAVRGRTRDGSSPTTPAASAPARSTSAV